MCSCCLRETRGGGVTPTPRVHSPSGGPAGCRAETSGGARSRRGPVGCGGYFVACAGARGGVAGAVTATDAALPAGPSEPPIVQTLRWLLRPISFLESCRKRYGDAFSVQFLGFETP